MANSTITCSLQRRRTPRRQARRRIVAWLAAVAATGSLISACGGSTDASSDEHEEVAVKVDAKARSLLPAETKEKGQLELVAPFTFPPYSYMNEDHKMAGSDYDIGNAVAKRLGLEPVWSRVETFEALIPSVQNGRFDATLDAIADTPERRDEVTMIRYQQDTWALAVAAGNPEEVDPNDLCGHTTGGVPGSAEYLTAVDLAEQCEKSGSEPMKVLNYKTGDQPIQALISGQIEVYPEFKNRILGTMEQVPGQLEVLEPDEPIHEPTVLVALVNPEQPDLARAMEAALKSLEADGTTEQILKNNDMDPGSIIKPDLIEDSLRD